MQGVAQLCVSGVEYSFQVYLVFRLIQTHLSRLLPHLEHSLDYGDFLADVSVLPWRRKARGGCAW